jgi:hypothetical protein
MINEYTGPISRAAMPPVVFKAYKSWDCQKQRAKRNGYSVEYDSRSFINWWLREYAKRKTWHKPSVNRIDHSKGYSFKNIFLDERSVNTAERNTRYTKKVLVFKGTKCVFKSKSIVAAARWAKVHPNNIPAVCRGERKTLGGYRFSYE